MLPDPADRQSGKKSHIFFVLLVIAVIFAAAGLAVVLPAFSRNLASPSSG